MNRSVATPADLVREICHAGLLDHVQDVYCEVGEFVQLLRSTGSALDQVKRSLDRLPVFDDRDSQDPADTVVEAMDQIARAIRRVADAEFALDSAWQTISHLGQTAEGAA